MPFGMLALLSPSVAAFRRVFKSARLRRLLGAFLFSSLAEFGTWVSILVWAHEVRGATFVGVVAAIQLVFAAVTSPVFSLIGDRMSRARALSVAYFGMAL